VTGVHRLQEIESFRTADLADDDPFGPHAQAVLDEIAHCNFAAALDVRRPCFEADHMRLLQLEFGHILAGNHALVHIDVIGHAVEKSCLSRARPAGNQDIALHPPDDFENLAAFRRDRAGTDQLIQGKSASGSIAATVTNEIKDLIEPAKTQLSLADPSRTYRAEKPPPRYRP
jgi:hypothetical protein